jgi:hypothetical protein
MSLGKNLIVFYSRTGNNKKIALNLKRKLRCPTAEILSVRNYKGNGGYFLGGVFSTFKIRDNYQPLKFNLKNFQSITLISPIWVGVLPPFVRGFLKNNKFTKLNLITVSGSGGEQKCLKDAEKLSKISISKKLFLAQKELKTKFYLKKLSSFAKEI